MSLFITFEGEEGSGKSYQSSELFNWLKNRDVDFNNFVIGTNNRFPIPYREISLVPMPQNPGY